MTTLATDAFTRGDSADLGTAWDTQTSEGAIALSSNKAARGNTHGGDTDSAENYNGVTWPNDQYSQAVLTATSGFTSEDGPGIGLRMSTSAKTYYRIVFSHAASNNVSIAKKVAGTYTSIGNKTQSWTDGATCYGEIQGTTLKAKINGTQVGTTSTDSGIASGRAGLAYSGEGSTQEGTWDDWEGGDFASVQGLVYGGRPAGFIGQTQMASLLAT